MTDLYETLCRVRDAMGQFDARAPNTDETASEYLRYLDTLPLSYGSLVDIQSDLIESGLASREDFEEEFDAT